MNIVPFTVVHHRAVAVMRIGPKKDPRFRPGFPDPLDDALENGHRFL
jgi:hypothetical protein